jgi:type IV fimbrial biogenesis protein FimT
LQARSQLLQASLTLARSEAIRGNRPVWVCSLNSKVNLDIQGCQPERKTSWQDWSEGVLVFADSPEQANGRYDSGGSTTRCFLPAAFRLVPASMSLPFCHRPGDGWPVTAL